jgi:hypothetical protein
MTPEEAAAADAVRLTGDRDALRPLVRCVNEEGGDPHRLAAALIAQGTLGEWVLGEVLSMWAWWAAGHRPGGLSGAVTSRAASEAAAHGRPLR